MKHLEGKVAIVTGASRGIGAATAVALGKAGANVVVNYINSAEAAKSVVEQIQVFGQKAIAVQADVRSPEDIKKMIDAAVEEFGRIDILVNNANIMFAVKPFTQFTWDEFSQKLNEEVSSAFHLCQGVIPYMEQQGGGRIVLISSSLSRRPVPGGFVAHGTAKAAINSFAKYLAQELGPKQISTNVVAPGMVMTDATKYQPAEFLQMMENMTPLGRIADPSDVAGAVLYLCSEWGSFVNGAYIPVNGGIDLD